MAKQRPKPTEGRLCDWMKSMAREENDPLNALAAMKWKMFSDKVCRTVPPMVTIDPIIKVRFLPKPSLA